jgi:hypothetical protein
MNSFYNFLQSLEHRSQYSLYLSMFRIFICVILMRNVIIEWQFMDILYRGTSFLPPSPSGILEMLGLSTQWVRDNIEIYFLIHIALIVLFFFGIGKHLTAIFVMLSYELGQRLCHITLNGGDNLLKFAMLYMVFADSYQYFSINQLKINKEFLQKISNVCTNLARVSICMHLCLAYALSAFHKVHADVWFNGIATYYTLSLERFQGTPYNLILAKNGFFVTITTYLTLITEMYFPVLIWFKKTRWLMMVLGLMLHSGIFVFMMIYDFQLIFLSIYGLFILDKEWKELWVGVNNFWEKVKMKLSKLTRLSPIQNSTK